MPKGSDMEDGGGELKDSGVCFVGRREEKGHQLKRVDLSLYKFFRVSMVNH